MEVPALHVSSFCHITSQHRYQKVNEASPSHVTVSSQGDSPQPQTRPSEPTKNREAFLPQHTGKHLPPEYRLKRVGILRALFRQHLEQHRL